MRISISHQIHIPISWRPRNSCNSLKAIPRLKSLSTGERKTLDVKACATLGPPSPFASIPPPPNSWKWWVIGALISAIFPFWGSRFGSMLKMKNEVEAVVEAADHIAEVVEKVAEKVEEVAEELADHLPEGGRLKNALLVIENVAKEIAKDAQIVDNVLDKVEEMEKEVVDSFIDKATGKNNPNN